MKRPAPASRSSLAQPIRTALRESPAVRAALARLRPADRAHASREIAEAIAAQLRRDGWME